MEKHDEYYKLKYQSLREKYRLEIQARDREINLYKEQINDLKNLIKSILERPIIYNNNLEAKAMADNSNHSPRNINYNAPIQGAGYVEGTNHYHASSAQRQSLSEAAEEIQRLLKQLEESNPTATEIDKIAYVSSSTRPDIKHRVIAVLKAGGDSIIDEFFCENKYLKVGKAVVNAWLQPGS